MCQTRSSLFDQTLGLSTKPKLLISFTMSIIVWFAHSFFADGADMEVIWKIANQRPSADLTNDVTGL